MFHLVRNLRAKICKKRTGMTVLKEKLLILHQIRFVETERTNKNLTI